MDYNEWELIGQEEGHLFTLAAKIRADKDSNKTSKSTIVGTCDECEGNIKKIDGNQKLCEDCMKEF